MTVGSTLVWMLAAMTLLSACDTSAYAFRVDERVRIVAPEARSTVTLPVTVRWTDDEPPAEPRVAAEDPEAEYYAVFVDRTPMGPGEPLSSLADEPERCADTPGCPDEGRLRDLGVLLTADTAVTLEFLADLRPSARASSKDPHELTIVRMRGDRRVGEAAFRVNFFVRR